MSFRDEFPGVDPIALINGMIFPNPIGGTWFSSREQALAAFRRDDSDDDSDVRADPVVHREFTKEDWANYSIPDEDLRKVYKSVYPTSELGADTTEGRIKAKIRQFANVSAANYRAVFDLLEPFVK